MAIGYETKTPIQETAPEPKLVQWSTNYDHVRSFAGQGHLGLKEYEEVAVFENPDGSRTINLISSPVDVPPDGSPEQTEGPKKDPRTLETSMWLDHSSFERIASECPPVDKALLNMGYRVIREENTMEGTIPSSDQVNVVMDYMRDQTGFAPVLMDFEGDYFSGQLMIEATDKAQVLAGTDIRTRSHDMLNHNPAWLFFPEETFKAIGSRGKQLSNKLGGFDDKTSRDYQLVKSDFKKHLTKLEQDVDISLIRELIPTIEDPAEGSHWAARRLYELTYDESMDTPEKAEVGEKLARQMAERILIAADMPQAAAA